MYISYYI